MKLIIILIIGILIYSWVCTKGYQKGREVSIRHFREQIQAQQNDLIHATDSLPEYSKRRLRENLIPHHELISHNK